MASTSKEEAKEHGRVVSIWHRFSRFFHPTFASNQTTQSTLKKAEEEDKQGIKSEQKTIKEDLIAVDITDDGQSEEHQSGIFEDANDEMIESEQETQPAKPEIQVMKDENDVSSVRQKIQQLQEESTTKDVEIQQLRSEKVDMSREISQVKQCIRELQEEKTNENDVIEHLQQEINNKDEKIEQLQQAINRYENRIRQIQNENTTKNNELLRLREENSNKNNANENLRQENNNKNDDIEKLLEENNNKDNEIEQLRQDNSNKDNEIEQLRQENNNNNDQIEQLREEIDSKNNELAQLREENTNKNSRIQQQQEEHQQPQETAPSTYVTEHGSVKISNNDELGRGSWGAVYKANFYGTTVAVKKFHDIIISDYNNEILQREIDIASQCRHPNLLQFICATRNEQDHLLIVTELMDTALRTLLEQRARKKSRLDYQEIKTVSQDVALGLNYLHSKKPSPIIHRDVSSANVLLTVEKGSVKRAKMSDFGSANFMQCCNTPNPGAALYSAPEARRAHHDPKIDVFSYGLLVCEMSISELPNQEKRKEQLGKIKDANIKALVEACTRKDPKTRPAMEDAIKFWRRM